MKKLVKFVEEKNLSLCLIAFFQALALVLYCSLVGMIFWQGDKWFGQMFMPLGPILVLVLLVVSVLICALLGLAYPIILFWEEKQTMKALKLVISTAGWLIFFVLLIMLTVAGCSK
jgi:hypothetical protein